MNLGPSPSSTNDDPLNADGASAGRSVRLGLQGRLTLAFLILITIALGSSCYLFASQSSTQFADLMGQQAQSIAYTLSLAAEPAIASGNKNRLDELSQDVLKTRNVLFIAFTDADRRPISVANRYADFKWSDVTPIQPGADAMYVVTPHSHPTFGEYVDVYTPVTGADSKRTGYVVVGVSLDREQAQLQSVSYLVAGIGVVMVILSLPVAYGIVYGIFKPIRHLVEATRKMAAGRMDFTIAVNRDDLIGELAGSFKDMMAKVRRHREDLNAANGKLAVANEQLNAANKNLSDANSALERKVLERTGQLEAANRRLTAEIDEKEDFLRAVSHDLNAPLRNISGMAAMLLMKHRDRFNEDIIHRLERIMKNVQVETDLISELLELSRIKTRRQNLERVDPAAVVNDLSGVFEEDLRSKQIQLVLDTPLPKLTVERARIRQVFQNLIDNAIKYMGDRPTREIHVGCTVGPDETEFYVRDTGIGIEADELGKVFHVFRRGKNAAVQSVSGKGVGLASVKSIVEIYSGSIWVESVFGQGTTFKFTINGKHVGDNAQLPVLLPEETSTPERRAA